MSTRSAWSWRLGLMVVLVGLAGTAFADQSSPSYMSGAMRKLGRGVVNVVSCPAELIRTPELVGRKEGYPAAMSVGILQGVWNTLARGGTGLVDVGTFFVKWPVKDFAPLWQPEFIYAHGDWAE